MRNARQQVERVLDQVAASLTGLEQPVLNKVFPVLEQAHREIERDLKLWRSQHHGADTFTAARYHNAMASIKRGLAILEHSGAVIEATLKHEFPLRVAPLSAENFHREWMRLGSIFEGTVQPIPLQEAVIIADGKKLLWPQFESSAEKYAARVGERTQFHLAVSRARGETIDELTNRLERHLSDVWNGNRWDAERLARTESFSSYNTAHHLAVEQAHDEDPTIRERWDGTYDFLRCQMCASLDGQVVNAAKGEKYIARWLTFSKRTMRSMLHVKEIERAPAHPNCVIGDTAIRSGLISGVSKRWYDGDVVIVRTASGKKLVCTPNHPILSRGGWIPARLLHVGDDVFSDVVGSGGAPGDVDHQDVPPLIHEIADALCRPGEVSTIPVPVSSEDFHGDGKGSDVAVVWSDRLLHDNRDPVFAHAPGNLQFVGADAESALLASHCSHAFFALAMLSAAYSFMSRSGARTSLLGCHTRRHHEIGIALAARLYSIAKEYAPHGAPNQAEPSGNRKLRLPGGVSRADRNLVNDAIMGVASLGSSESLIAADRIVGVECQWFSGHVFNIETEDGWYKANSIVTHNCRCSVTVWKEAWAKYARTQDPQERLAAAA